MTIPMAPKLLLRDVVEDDLTILFEQQKDTQANFMAAFTAKEPTDRSAFIAHWNRIMADPAVLIKTITVNGQVVGHVLRYEELGRLEVSYWIGKEYWGRGFATQALAVFLDHCEPARPIYARAVKDNLGSLRVLEKCGFSIIGEEKGFANARGAEVDELILELNNASGK